MFKEEPIIMIYSKNPHKPYISQNAILGIDMMEFMEAEKYFDDNMIDSMLRCKMKTCCALFDSKLIFFVHRCKASFENIQEY